jgi:HAMP domain-containing protein
MKVIRKMIMVGALGLALAINVNAQTSPYLSISNNFSNYRPIKLDKSNRNQLPDMQELCMTL